MTLGTRDRINAKLEDITGWGDYAGSMVARANSSYLLEFLPKALVTVTREYGYTALVLAPTVRSADLQAIMDVIEDFRGYPDITDDFGDCFVRAETLKWYGEYGILDIAIALSERVTWTGNTLLSDVEAVVAAAASQELEQYWETATDFHSGHTDETMNLIIDTLLDEYASEQTEALQAGLVALAIV